MCNGALKLLMNIDVLDIITLLTKFVSQGFTLKYHPSESDKFKCTKILFPLSFPE